MNEVRTSVLDVIGNANELSVIVKQLNFEQCTYLLSVYRLESLRVANDTSSFHQIFTYLENKPIQKDKAGMPSHVMTSIFGSTLLDRTWKGVGIRSFWNPSPLMAK